MEATCPVCGANPSLSLPVVRNGILRIHCNGCGSEIPPKWWDKPSGSEALARKFHDTYERLAPQFGYETRQDTKQFDPTSPNGRLMIAVCSELTRGD